MLISAGRLGPANMAKSKNEKGGRQKERKRETERNIQCSYKLGSIKKKKKKNIVRSHVNENDLM